MNQNCIVCGKPIHPERLAAFPRTITCKREHSLKHKRNLSSASSTRCHRRQRAAKKEREQ